MFGFDYRNRTLYYKGSMDNIAIYSESLSGYYVKALYESAVQTLPSRSPTTQLRNGTTSTNSNADNKSGGENGCSTYCIMGISIAFGSLIVAVCGICVAYHVYYLERQDKRTYAGVSSNAISARDNTHRI